MLGVSAPQCTATGAGAPSVSATTSRRERRDPIGRPSCSLQHDLTGHPTSGAGGRASFELRSILVRLSGVLVLGTVVLIGCGGSSEETETFSVQDGTGTSYELTVTTDSSQECFELDGGDLGEWCGEQVENVTTVEVIGSAGSGVPNEGDAGTRFTYAVVGIAPIGTDSVRVRLDDSIQEVPVTEGEGYSAWAAMFDITVPSDEPLESPPQPTISAEASD